MCPDFAQTAWAQGLKIRQRAIFAPAGLKQTAGAYSIELYGYEIVS